MKNLIIVESPAKAKTIKKYLGKDFEVIASMGHVRDLQKSKLSVDIENNFEPKYVVSKDKTKLVNQIKKDAKAVDNVYLATDPDREGEAISWHLAYILGLDPAAQNRVEFNEITKKGVTNGMQNPRSIDIDLVNAQQARRVLDRIVGYTLSPFLSQKIRRGLSGGRVQSVAVRLIVDRENEIRQFNPEEYWSIESLLYPKGGKTAFSAMLHSKGAEKIKIANKQQADTVLAELEGCEYTVAKVKNGTKKIRSSAPFITSTLQQDASRKLGFQSKRTMKVAQELYEGIDIADMGTTGLITYMRTDSLRVSQTAIDEVREFILSKYGADYLPKSPRIFKSKASSQDGHEAIRPAMPSLEPDAIKSSLTSDQYKLYKLIWQRFAASQMTECVHNTTAVDIAAGDYIFKANDSSVKFNGFTLIYTEGKDFEEEKTKALPKLSEGDVLKLKELLPKQHFTEPPARFNEASLIKALEEYGIGRPSTYAATISTILSREYVKREGKALLPTELGEAITKLMKDHFENIVNVKFTAKMEEELDTIEKGEIEWVKVLSDFYGDYSKTLAAAKQEMEGQKIKLKEDETDFVCELCGRKMVVKTGRFGKFIACPGYPECKNIKKFEKGTGVTCPKCGGEIIEKKSKKGRIFYGCNKYPTCDFSSWTQPSKEKCPQCGGILFVKKGKKPSLVCQAEGCGFIKQE